MDIWNEIISVVVSNGIFATLFVFLFFYQLKDSAKREKAYQKTITDLTVHLQTIEEVKSDVEELKNVLVKTEKRGCKKKKDVATNKVQPIEEGEQKDEK